MAQAPRILAGRYEVGELIGRGGMAEVHIGHDARLGRTVAIKILRSDLARDPSFQARFRREAQSAASLNHPAIVAVYDTGEETYTEPTGAVAHVPFIVMEYVEGHTVRDIVRDGHAVPIDEAVEIITGVLSALEYSHQAGIVHRDIKPANVMLTPTGAVKVMDFGIARAMADSAATMTATQAVIGTAQYLSPEQARGETVDARSDLYSTGCLLFELLTGRPPFTGDSPVAVAYQHVREAPPLPSSLAGDVPESLDRITLRALAKERDARYSSAAEFRADLEAAMHGGHITAPSLAAVSAAATGAPAPGPDAATTQMLTPQTQALPTSNAWAPTGMAPTEPPTDGMGPDVPGTSRAGLKWTLITIGVIAIAALIFLILTNNAKNAEPAVVSVPALVGMNSIQAKDTLTKVKLEMKALSEPSNIEKGLFVKSDPMPGTDAKEGDVIDVYFSSGPSSVKVPDVTGYSAAAARTALEAADLQVDLNNRLETGGSVPRENVTRTEPKAGEPVESGSTVQLFISDGQVDVPSVLELDRDEASKALRDLKAGLEVQINTAESDQPESTVIDQQPKAGTIAQGSTVILTVAIPIPPQQVPIPANIVGMSQKDAERALRDLNLEPKVELEASSIWHAGIVVGVTPPVALEGSEVTLYVSTGPGPEPDPIPDPVEPPAPPVDNPDPPADDD